MTPKLNASTIEAQTVRLLFNDGGVSAPMKTDGASVTAAIRNMLAESRTRFAHRLHFRMKDGSAVIVRKKRGDQ
jgi:hypothetical protein